jgi:glycosyltransferase involved in cell wall biosynthesis
MRIAIVHYHLKRGGVTRVIESTLQGFETLETPPRCVVLAGDVPDNFRYGSCARAVEGLHYSNAQAETPDSRELLERMRQAAHDALGGEPDVWHIHNHSLGKNSAMPGVVSELAESGEAVLLQMHDFAEDGRPENYRLNQERPECAAYLYPDCPNVHYGIINARDTAIFAAAGLSRRTGVPPVSAHTGSLLHLLPNPVEVGVQHSAAPATASLETASIREALGAERLFLYPVRAVRRKNFGEMLLWAALADEGDVFATTLGPTNQNYVTTYENWQAFARQHELPVHFAIGERDDWSFESIMQSAHAILSTSIAEGFGLAFLEPWLFGKSIAGRNLPEITADFTASGIQLDHLYDCLPIPSDWIDLEQLHADIQKGLTEAYAAYERPLPEDAAARALAAISPSPGYIDFAGLNEALQQNVIERVLSDPQARSQLPMLSDISTAECIQTNAGKIKASYSLEQYSEKLVQIYQSIRSSDNTPATQYIDPAKVLDGFLQPERFRLLRT